jgi:ABC-type antimicrobial peptide transport system permease subunit
VWSTLKCRCSKYSITSKPPGEFRGLAEERVTAMLSSFFAALALFLDSVVLYGLMSYAVTRRTREIGIRVAVGANRKMFSGSCSEKRSLWCCSA